MAKQSAIDWIIERFLLNDKNIMHVMIKAKLMEKEQIIEAHNHGEYFASTKESLDDKNGEQYYKETYTK